MLDNDLTTTFNEDNYAVVAEAMGMGVEVGTSKHVSDGPVLSRLRIWHQPLMQKKKNEQGKMRNVEIVPGGTYRLDDTAQHYIYSEKVSFRPYLQQFFYSQYIPFSTPSADGKKGQFTKSVMVGASKFNKTDLMDTAGGFNCGRPSGYLENWEDLPETERKRLASIRRVRALFGLVTMHDPVEVTGESAVSSDPVPAIWEIENREAYKLMGDALNKVAAARRLLPQHEFQLQTTGREMPNGLMVYTPVVSTELSREIELAEEDNIKFSDFQKWVANYNSMVKAQYDKNHTVSAEEMKVIDDFVTIEGL